jgi:CAAX protease family protein
MAGIVVELIVSWLLLRIFQRQGLNALGLLPSSTRVIQLFSGIFWAILFFAVFEYSASLLVHNPYRVNPDFHGKELWRSTSYLLKSVAYEDLIFRGALLYILLQKIGPQKSLLISAAAFGIYHWFSYGAFGNPAQMLLIFFSTGIVGYVFALAFERTRSMYLPFGLHFGVDFALSVLFSQQQNIGRQLLYRSFAKDPVSLTSWLFIVLVSTYYFGFPAFTFFGLRRMRRVESAV